MAYDKLVNAFLLGTIEHDLVNGLSQERLSEATDHVLRVCFVKDLNQVVILKDPKHVKDRGMRFVPQGTDVLEDSRAKDVTNNGCTLEQHESLSK